MFHVQLKVWGVWEEVSSGSSYTAISDQRTVLIWVLPGDISLLSLVSCAALVTRLVEAEMAMLLHAPYP